MKENVIEVWGRPLTSSDDFQRLWVELKLSTAASFHSITERSYMYLSNSINFMIASSGLQDTSRSSQNGGSYRPTKFCVFSYNMFCQV